MYIHFCVTHGYIINLILTFQVRGPKHVVRLFSHEVIDVEPVLGMLSQQNPQDHEVHICKLLLSRFGFNVAVIYTLF